MRKKGYFTPDKEIQSTTEKAAGKVQQNAEPAGLTEPDNSREEHGKIRYTLKNDYMFKAVFQSNKKALKSLIAALLDRDIGDIRDIKIENPIILGESIEEKTVILDIMVTLNDSERINIEMQVVSQKFWTDRSLVYVCRNFASLNKGESYNKVQRTIHIGILDFNLPVVGRQLYAKHKIMNVKTHNIYSDKIELNVLSLPNIKYASKKEKKSELYYWAKVFAAETWEDLKMAATTEAMRESVSMIRKLTADERIRMQCEAREKFLLDMKTRESVMQEQEAEIKKMKKARREADRALRETEKARKEAEAGRKKEKEFRKKAEDTARQEKTARLKAEARIKELERLLAEKEGIETS